MTFHLKTYPDALRQLFVACSVEETTSAFNKALSILQQKFTLPGYRKGKVPIEMITKSNPPELMSIVSDILMKDALEYIDDQKTPLYGQPRFNPMGGLSQNKEFLFSLVYEIYPTITQAPDISTLKFSYEACEINQKFVEDTMCRQMQLLDTVSGTIQDFDLIKIEILNNDYKGDKKESSFDASKLEILVGKKTEETISIAFDDLSGYLPEFLGKVSDPLQIKILEISRAKDWKKVTDAEIEEKTPFKTKEEYTEQSKKQFENAVLQYNNTKKAEVFSNTISPKIKIELPKSLWLNNLRDITLKTAEKEIIREEVSLESLLSNKEISNKFSRLPVDAIEGLAFIVWLENTAQKEKISIDDAELEYYYYRYAQSKNIPMNDFKKHISQEERESIKNEAVREKTMSHLLEKTTFTVSNTIPLSEAIKIMNKY